jgi:hypothetical protein
LALSKSYYGLKANLEVEKNHRFFEPPKSKILEVIKISQNSLNFGSQKPLVLASYYFVTPKIVDF